jgi:hypothetical protein
MLSFLLLGCIHIFVDSTNNVSSQKEVVDLWHAKELKKQMLAFGHLQGMYFKTFGMDFNMLFIHIHKHNMYMLHNVFLKHMKMNIN